MSLSIALGLLSALLYGLTDFVARFASREVGVLRTMLYAQWLAALALAGGVAFVGIPSAPGKTWFLLIVSDALVLGATACLYRALALGRLIVVAPVAASYGGVTAVLSAFSGERLSLLDGAALGLLLVGAVLVARPAEAAPAQHASASSGLALATSAALLYGGGFWMQGRYVVAEVGSLTAVWSYYLLGSAVLPCICLARRVGLSPPRGRGALWVCASGVCAVGAYLALAAGQRAGSTAIATMLSSLSSAVTVLLGLVLLRERVALPGWLGLLAIVGGLVLLRL